jgi:RNA polymerase sigma factor (sigma-70 family)
MSSTQVGAVLRHIRQFASARKDCDEPDRQLLERFAAHRDEAAFAALLKRHGPMVLRVCRSVLHGLQDAEDAFQAVFLVLAQKAGSIHRRESVSSWLYQVAYHLALRAKANAARRKVLEERAVTMPSVDPVLDLSLRELQSALFKELEGLPEQYRAPLVLCGLEEKSLDEAARLLGWTRWTVKGRLQRGRELLRARLRRRGLDLSLGLCVTALALSSASGRVSATLADATLRAALNVAAGQGVVTGGVSAEVAALVQGASKTMFSGKSKVATVLLLALAAGAAGLGAITLRALAGGSANLELMETATLVAPQESKQPVRGEKDTLTIRGQVLDPDAKPVAGAKLYLHDAKLGEKDYPTRSITGDNGRFEFTFAKSELDQPASGYSAGGFATSDHPTSHVMAVAKGFGCAWATVGEVEAERALTLRLVKDVPISGRVLDGEGKPVAGAKVRVAGVDAYTGEDLSKMIEHFRLRGWPGGSEIRWESRLPEQANVSTTAADGRFRLAGFGRERSVWLIVEGPAIEYTSIMVMTRLGEAVLGPKPPQRVRQFKLYGATFDYLAAPSRLLRGVVRDKATGKPVAGVTLWSNLTTHRPRTDKEGRYEMLGCPKSATYALYLEPPDGLHFRIQARVNDTLGLEPLAADIALPSGIPVRGRVLDKSSGKPVPGVRISYYVVFPNSKVGRLDNYHEYEGLSIATSGADGAFAITVLPGPGVLAAAAQPLSAYRPALVTPMEIENFLKERPKDLPINQDVLVVHGSGSLADARHWMISQSQYNALALINPEEKDKSLVRDVELLPALTRKGTLVGPDGKPILDVTAIGLDNRHSEVTLKSANFTVLDLHPARSRELFFYHKEKNLGRFLALRGDQSAPLKVELQSCGSATGRVVDKDGKPVSGLHFSFCRDINPNGGGRVDLKTDQDGRFRAESLVPGQKYCLRRPHEANVIDPASFREVTVKPGEKIELGNVTFTLDGP